MLYIDSLIFLFSDKINKTSYKTTISMNYHYHSHNNEVASEPSHVLSSPLWSKINAALVSAYSVCFLSGNKSQLVQLLF